MSNKKRVAIIGLNKFPIPAIKGGAIESGVTNTININEIKQRLDLTLFTIKDSDLDAVVEKYKHCKIIQINEKGFISFILFFYRIFRKLSGYCLPEKSVYMIKINRYLLKEQFDIVYFATSNNQVAQVSNRVQSKILYLVASDYLTKRSYGIDKICKRVTAFLSNEYICDRIVELLGVDSNKVKVLKGGIDISIDDFKKRLTIRLNIRGKHHISDDEVVVLYVGRLSPEKGPLELIKAIQQVPTCKLLVVGGADFSSGEETDYVKKLKIEAEKCNGRVIFTGYLKEHDDIKKYMYAADIGVVPSICNEAGSVTLLEYRVAEVPTIVSNMGGMIYNAGENVVFVDCNEKYIDNLATAIQALCDNPEKRKYLASVARKNIENRSLEAGYDRLCDYINSL